MINIWGVCSAMTLWFCLLLNEDSHFLVSAPVYRSVPPTSVTGEQLNHRGSYHSLALSRFIYFFGTMGEQACWFPNRCRLLRSVLA